MCVTLFMRTHKDLFTPDRKPMTDQNKDTTKVQTGAPIVSSPKLVTWSILQNFQAVHWVAELVSFLVDQLVSAISVQVNGLSFLLGSTAGLKLFLSSPYCLYMLGEGKD